VTAPDRWLETGRLAELGLLTAELLHEVRQPVFAIKALSQMLHVRADGGDRAQLETLLDQVAVLERIIDRYAGSGRPPSALLTALALGPAVEAGVLLLKHRADSRGIVLDLEVVAEGGVVRGEQAAIQQVTTNLVHNALDAAATRVDVHVEKGVLTISDDGPGIPLDIKERLFEPFVTSKPPGKGTGLGLAVSRHLMTLLGGQLVYTDGATPLAVTPGGPAGDGPAGDGPAGDGPAGDRPAGTRFVATFQTEG
jgi:two-component system, NtrC family, C4-dicarboxylate transport sensor histidine kinase DctB